MAELIEIATPDDPRLRDYRDLRDVQLRTSLEVERGLFIAEGEKVITRALLAGHQPRSFMLAPRWLAGLESLLAATDAPCYVVSEALAEQVSGFHVHRGALASLQRQALPTVTQLLQRLPDAGPCRIAVLESLVDHGNVGSIFRNAAAFGLDAVLVTQRCADPLYRRAVKTSMGNVFSVPWTRTPADLGPVFDELRAADFACAALTLTTDAVAITQFQVPPRIALFFGTEGDGVTPATAAACDVRVKIPMRAGVDSLNVAAASAVAFYAVAVDGDGVTGQSAG